MTIYDTLLEQFKIVTNVSAEDADVTKMLSRISDYVQESSDGSSIDSIRCLEQLKRVLEQTIKHVPID